MPQATPPPRPTEEKPPPSKPLGGSFLLRVGACVGASALAAAVAAVPATLRVGGGAPAWATLASIALLPMLAAVPVLRQARVGLRAYGGPGASAKAVGIALWLSLLFAMLTPFGALLRATTHQHALAGVTFALGASVLAIVLAIVCVRLVTMISARGERTQRTLVVVASGLLVAAIALGAVRLAHSLSGASALPASAGTMLIDGLAFAITALFASRATFASRRPLAIFGPPGAAILLVLGVSLLHGSATVADAIAVHAPAFAAAGGFLLGH